MAQNKKMNICKNDNHREYLNLPCDHDTCRICFFDEIKNGSGRCSECNFVIDELDEYAKLGNRSACYIIGHMHHIGTGGREKNLKLAEKYYLESAIFLGNDYYIYGDIGNLYYMDLNNENKAFEWYDRLYNAINLEYAQERKNNNLIIYSYELQNLAKLNIYGHNDYKTDGKRALEILTSLNKLCPNNDICWYIGEIYHKEIKGIMKNLMEAYKWYEFADCKYSMGIIQYETKNYQMAIKLLKLVPKENEFYFEACKKLGKIYSEECDYRIQRSHTEAKQWYEKSLSDKDYMGYLEIGKLYEDGGYGITRDYIEAGIYYKLFIDKNKNPEHVRKGYDSLMYLYKKISDSVNEQIYRTKCIELPYCEDKEVRLSKKRKYIENENKMEK